MLTGSQIRAARGLLGWTLADLAKRTGLQNYTISFFENGKGRTEFESIEKMVRALEQEGVEFTTTGVQLVTPIYTIEGPNMYVDLLDDVIKTNAKDVIIENADERITPPHIIQKFKEMKMHGFTVRMTVEEGNTFLLHDIKNYRAIPKKHFQNWVMMTYGPKVAMVVSNSPDSLKAIIISQEKLADAMRNRFALVWDLLQPIDAESTADERIL